MQVAFSEEIMEEKVPFNVKRKGNFLILYLGKGLELDMFKSLAKKLTKVWISKISCVDKQLFIAAAGTLSNTTVLFLNYPFETK